MKELALGIIGTGRIANRFVAEIDHVLGIKIVAVYNPHINSASFFSEKHNIQMYTDDIVLFMESVDAVYIASPHETHFSYIDCALRNSKHVLCEKPFVLCKEEAEYLFDLANSKNCILLEAIKTAYCPGFLKILELISNNVIGEVKDVEAAFTKLEKTDSRELSDMLYGGSFTELASYTLLPIIKILGQSYVDLRFETLNNERTIDIYSKAYFKYDEAFATAKTGLGVKSEGQLVISGTHGYILVRSPWWKTKQIEVCFENPNDNMCYEIDYEEDGLRYEIQYFVSLINGEKVNSYMMTSEESIVIAGIIEKFIAIRMEKMDVTQRSFK